MKRLTLHIGMPKSGSTSIQAGLKAWSQELLALGICYPGDLAPHNFSFYPLALSSPHNFLDWKQSFSPEEVMEVQDWYRHHWEERFLQDDAPHWVISSELLFFLELTEIRRLKNWLSDYFDEIDLILNVRHPLGFFQSMIQQEIKNGTMPHSIEDGLRKLVAEVDYSEIITRWIEVFGRNQLTTVYFDPQEPEGRDPFMEFLRHLGVKASPEQKFHQNASIGLKSLSILAHYNQRYPVMVKGRINPERGLCLRHIPDPVFEKADHSGRRFKASFTREEALKINRDVDFLNELFKDRHLLDPVTPADGKLEMPPFDEIGEDYFIELINEYHRHIEHLMDFIDSQDRLLKEHYEGERPVLEEPVKPVISGSDTRRVYEYCQYVASNKRWKNRLRNLKYYTSIKGSDRFDKDFYIRGNPRAGKVFFDPAVDYLLYGVAENRNPSRGFSNWDYFFYHKDALKKGMNPLVHWIMTSKGGSR